MLKDLILCIDTSSDYCSVCLGNNDTLLYNKTIHTRDHAENLAQMMNEALSDRSNCVAQILVTNGPGSFTGLRCGIAFGIGLAKGLDVPINGISCFQAISCEIKNAGTDLLVVLDSKRENVYCQRLDMDLKPLSKAEFISLKDILPILSPSTALITNIKNVIEEYNFVKNKYLIDCINITNLITFNKDFYSSIFPVYLQNAPFMQK